MFTDKSKKIIKMIIGIIFELLIISFTIKQYIISPVKYEISISIILLIVMVIFFSNIASSWIVGYIKDEYLWVKVNDAFKNSSKSMTVKEEWYKDKLYSPISHLLGITERIVIVVSGLIAFQFLLLTLGGWISIKIATDWSMFARIKYRAISQIYLISCVLSLAMGVIDVLWIKALLMI